MANFDAQLAAVRRAIKEARPRWLSADLQPLLDAYKTLTTAITVRQVGDELFPKTKPIDLKEIKAS